MTLELPADSPALSLPWIITIGPLTDDEEWEPVVCGPYERPHALALAGSVVADEELMAVVGPVQPHVTVDQIRADIVTARLNASLEDPEADVPGELGDDPDFDEPSDAPPPDEVRDGFARVAARLIRA